MRENTCADCRWWDEKQKENHPMKKDAIVAPCKLNPPQPVSMSGGVEDQCPWTVSTDWCGHFAAREPAKREAGFALVDDLPQPPDSRIPGYHAIWNPPNFFGEKTPPPKRKRWMVDTRKNKSRLLHCENCWIGHNCGWYKTPSKCPAEEVECENIGD